MKKTLLIASVLATSISFGQKKIVAITNYVYNESGSLNYIDSNTYTYNSGQGDLNEFKPTFGFNYNLFDFSTPDQNEKFLMHSDIKDSYTGTSNPLFLTSTTNNTLTNGKVVLADDGGNLKSHYAYDAQGNMIMKANQYFDGTDWITQDSIIYTYDAMGNQTIKENYVPINGSYVSFVDSMFYNTGTNQLNKVVQYYFEPSINDYLISEQCLISHIGTKVEHVDIYSDDGNGGVEWAFRITYNYSGNNPTGFTAYTVMNNFPIAAFASGNFISNAQNLHSEFNVILQGDTITKYLYEYDLEGFMTKRTSYEIDMNNDLYLAEEVVYTYQNQSSAGVAEVNQVSVKVFPNPSSSSISIQSDSPIKTVRVFNLSGQMVMEQNSGELDIQGLTSGTYVLHGTTENGVFQSRVVKQ